MRYILLFLIFLANVFLWGEIVTVPKYNYSVYPLEGWALQEYSDDSELSWLSNDNGVAFSIASWSGEVFLDIDDMFHEVTSGFNASGDFVRFDYLNRNCAIGEITFVTNNKEHKGWILLIDGSDFDYYLSAFSLLENYNDKYSEIQSALDSFAIGKNGELLPGPMTTFLDATPTKKNSIYTIDFFGQELKVSASEVDFSSSQTLIEREATVMLNYSNDPENFYKAWQRYYKLIYRDSYSRLEGVYKSLFPYLSQEKYDDYKRAELIMFWIQGYEYKRDLKSTSDLLNPLESAITKTGDCDARSLVMGILLKKFGIDSVLLTSEKVKHAIIAVKCQGDGAVYNFEGEDYLTVELTAKALIGEIKESMADPGLWTPVSMEYKSDL